MGGGLVLASGSARRRELLGVLGVGFEVVVSGVVELVGGCGLSGVGLVEGNARLKALAVSEGCVGGCWVLGVDTVVVLDGRVLGKPGSLDEAEGMLLALQGRGHVVLSGVCLVRDGVVVECWHVGTGVGLRELGVREVRDYLRGFDALGVAGGYAIQVGGERVVSWVDGSLSNVVGLPLAEVGAMLRRRGIVG